MHKVFATTALTIAASATPQAFAQSGETPRLDPVIVSAGISPVAADEYGRSYSVVTARDIRERGLATVQDAIAALPGVSLSGDAPSNTQIRIRGGEAGHTLVLIDGVRAAAGDSEYFLRGLDTASIERIELLRGPQSVPYGTDASTGVINIITRQARQGLNQGVAAELGEGDRQSGYLTYGGERGALSVNLSRRYDAGYDYSGDGGEDDTTTWEALHATGRVQLGRQLSARMVMRAADGDWDSDALAPFDSNTFASSATSAAEYIQDDATLETSREERLVSLAVTHDSLAGRLRQRLRVDRTENESVPSSGSATEEQTDLVQYRLELAADGRAVRQSDQLWAMLLERKEDSGESSARYERQSDSLAVEYQGSLTDAWSLQAGIRRDDNEAFADETTWNVATAYRLGDGVRLHASAGRAIVNPGFASIFGTDGIFPTVGNPTLSPEENQGYEVGVEMPVRGLGGFVDLTYFNETLTDEIIFTGVADPYNYENQTGDSDREGLELTTEIPLGDSVRIAGRYTYLDATDPDGSREIRRPRHEYGLNARWRPMGTGSVLSADLRHVRGLYDDQFWAGGEDGARLPNFTVIDLAATQSLSDHVTLVARVDNVLDEDYAEVWGYATRGRAAYLGVRAAW